MTNSHYLGRLTRLAAPAVALALGLQMPAAAQEGVADSVAQNEDRLDELEDLIFELDERVGSRALWSSYTGQEVTIGGHVTSAAVYIKRKDHESVSGVPLHFFELYVKADLGEDFSVFVTPGFYYLANSVFATAGPGGTFSPLEPAGTTDPELQPDDPSSTEETHVLIERAYGEYNHSDALRVRFGRIGSGHGVVTREYFVPSRTLINAPMHVRTFGRNSLYPQRVEGLQIAGTRRQGHDTIGYELYAGSSQGTPDYVGSGTRLSYTVEDLGLELAANWGQNRRAGIDELTGIAGANLGSGPTLLNPFPAVSANSNFYNFWGLDLDWRTDRWRVKGEIYETDESGFDNRFGAYIQPTYYMTPKVALTVRADYFDAGQVQTIPLGGGGTTPGFALGHSKELVAGVMLTPIPSVSLRFDVHHNFLPRFVGGGEVTYAILSMSMSF